MRVAIGTFARQAIEIRHGSDLVAGLAAALRHYARRLASGSTPAGLPSFPGAAAREGAPVDLEVPVERDVEQTLAREVSRLGASLDQLMTHAVFVYLADLDRSPWCADPSSSAS